MENQARFCTTCGTALVADARFCPNCGTACAVSVPVAEPVAEPAAEPVVEPVAEPIVEPVAEPVAESKPAGGNLAMSIVAMACGIFSFLLTLILLEEGGMWESFGGFLFISPGIALGILFGVMNLTKNIAARMINGIIFCAVGLGTAAFAATINMIDLLVRLS